MVTGVISVEAKTCVWTGANGSSFSGWSYSDNWQDGNVPVDGDDLDFPSSAVVYAAQDNIPSLTYVNSITIRGGYAISAPGAGVGSLGLVNGMTVIASLSLIHI